MPPPIKQIVQKQNLEFHHHKSHYSYSFFQFMKQLLKLNYEHIKFNDQSTTASSANITVRGRGWRGFIGVPNLSRVLSRKNMLRG